jgi:hypothetical protein
MALKSARRALLVIAHPDDESMFFAPTLHTLHSQGAAVLILCLSNGEYICPGPQHGTPIIMQCTTVQPLLLLLLLFLMLLCGVGVVQETEMAWEQYEKRSFWQRAGFCR